ncbi:hypothetical protein FRC04_001445 [Tulasnella sp. 424]|nr:hypothetical protein FRC04_001445 [Tulasnella sp. 424]
MPDASPEPASKTDDNSSPIGGGNGPSLSHTSNPAPLRQLHGLSVNALTDAYLFTGDAKEHERLDDQHVALCLMIGGFFPTGAQSAVNSAVKVPENGPKPAILDLGTGSGAWAIGVAKQVPHADVVGLDLVPVNPSSELPPNCTFEVCDVNTALDRYSDKSFNVVHMRMMLQGIKDYATLFNQVSRILRPGGVLVVIEAVWTSFDANMVRIQAEKPTDPGFTWLYRIMSTINDAIVARHSSFLSIERVHEIIEELGKDTYKSVSNYSFFMPVGAWPTDLTERQAGELIGDSVIRAQTSIRPLLLNHGITGDELDRWAEGLQAEVKGNKVHQYIKIMVTWAVKVDN